MEPFPGTLKRAPDGYHPYVLTKEQEAWLRATFPVTENRIVEKAMGLTHPTLYRIVSALGLQKSEEGMKAIRQRQSKDHARMNRHNRLLLMSGHHPDKCTNIRATAFTEKQKHCRHRAAAIHGYVVYNGYDLQDGDDDRYKIFYNEETKRSARFEATCKKYGLIIEREDYGL